MNSTSINRGSSAGRYAPFMVVNPGETLPEAVQRHRRDTGHTAALIVTAFNGLSLLGAACASHPFHALSQVGGS